MHVFSRIFLTVIFSLSICSNGYCLGNKGVVTKKMIDMASKLAVKAHSNGGQSKLDVTSTSIVEVGNNKGHGLPVKFQIKGQETYKDLEDYPPGYTGGFPVLLRNTIDKKRQFNAVEVFRYSTDEFDKLIVCTDSGYTCLKEVEEVTIQYRLETATDSSSPKEVHAKDVISQKREFEFKMSSGNMEDTIKVKDNLTINKNINELKQKDIIAYEYREDTSKVFIGRIVGMPNDTVEIKDKIVYVNGVVYEEEYAVHKETAILPASLNPRDNKEPITLSNDEYFILGDNRDRSYDCRFWGPVRKHEIIGKVIKIGAKNIAITKVKRPTKRK